MGVLRRQEQDAVGDGWHDALLMDLLAEELVAEKLVAEELVRP